jgi:serine/threonine-protein kinase
MFAPRAPGVSGVDTDTAGVRDDLRGRLQAALGSAYTLERELGGGGMSRVFVARDVRLGRRVVVKVLHPELAAGLSARRFEREVQLEARLQHPHVLPLLSAGEVEALPYYTTPYVEGESLRQRLAAHPGGLPLADAVRLLRELADALAYAHAQGVVHRDLKPENVLLSGRHAVVADFGVAKAVAAATHGGGTAGETTGLGVAVGTPAYMAPEQAAGDPAADHRVDLYALGVVAYEMLAGTHPFARRSPHAMVAAHLTEAPAPLVARRPDAPPALAALVMGLLAKDPADRPPSAAAVLAALEDAGVAMPAAAAHAAAPAAAPPSLGTGRRWWIAAGTAALLAATAAVAVRTQAAGGAHDGAPADRLLVADFEDQAGDSTLARTVARALRIDLARSPRIELPTAQELRQGLALMRADTTAPLGPDVALALGRRLGGKAVLDGAVSGAGRGYVLTARLTATADGRTVATFRETAADSSAVIGAIDRLSRAVRRAVGESVASLEATPTLYVTTRSLPALTAYGRELRAAQVGDWISVAERAREATTLDPEFAEAHRHLGIALSNIGVRRAERVQAFTRAYALRDRLSPYERGLAEASYFSYALGDDRRAAERYRAMVPEFPLLVTPRRGTTPRNNLYTVYNRLGEWALALRVSRALVDSVPTLRVFRRNHVEALITAGALDAADTAVRSMARDFPGQSITAVAAAWVAAARRDYAGALAVVDSALRTADPQSTGRVDLLGQQRTVTATLGRLAARARADAELAGEYSRLGGGPELLTLAAEQAQVEAALGRPDRARAALGAALGRYPLAPMAPLDRPYAALAAAWATAGDPRRAARLLDERTRAVPALHQGLDALPLLRARVLTALSAGRPAEAERLARDGEFGACGGCAALYLARAFDARGRADSAVAAYERYLGATAGRDLLDPTELARAYRRLGELYEARGDVPRALQRYGDFVALWAGADAALHPAIAGARERVRRLRARAD